MNFQSIVTGYPKYLIKRLLNLLLPHPLQQANSKLKNIHQGDTCFILGSGPSIKNQDLKKLSGQIVITQNHFHSHEDISIIRPKYHIIVPKYQPEEYDKDWSDWIKSMEELLPKDCILFADTNTKYLLDRYQYFQNRTHYIHTGLNPLYMKNAVIDITKNVMSVPTVLTECLTIALFMGFSKIYLTGFDLNQVCFRQTDRDSLRFYGMSHITKNAAEQKIDDETGHTGREWFWMWEIWVQLNLLKNYADKHGIQILNATQGGLLNIFKRVDYNNILT